MNKEAVFYNGCLILDNKEHDVQDVIMPVLSDGQMHDISFSQAALLHDVIQHGMISNIRVELSHIEFDVEYENEQYHFKFDLKPGINPMITFFHGEQVINKDMADLQLELFES